jgi:transcriptional regulator with XRE-family HTH domain
MERNMNDWMIFAERLSEQMKKQNLSIRQLAERMDMTPTTIFRYARGQRVPRANEILKASDVLGVTCDYLIGLSDDPKKTSRSTVQQERKTGRWIPVSERFPEEGEEVLVYLFDGQSPYLAWIQDGLWRTEDFEIDADNEPVAWMPLPEPYQAERREE